MGYRDQGVALTELIAHLIEERTSIDEQLFGAEQQLRELTASKKRKTRVWWRPSLVEVGLVGVIFALIAPCAGIAVLPQFQHAKEHSARSDMGHLKDATVLYRVESGKGCPALDDMVAVGALQEGQYLTNPWGGAYRIHCLGTDTFITSAGPDAQHGTRDDI